jgi:hypothetical protein
VKGGGGRAGAGCAAGWGLQGGKWALVSGARVVCEGGAHWDRTAWCWLAAPFALTAPLKAGAYATPRPRQQLNRRGRPLARRPHPALPLSPSNPVSFMNWLGSGIAIWGTYLYSVATDKHKEELAAKKKAA